MRTATAAELRRMLSTARHCLAAGAHSAPAEVSASAVAPSTAADVSDRSLSSSRGERQVRCALSTRGERQVRCALSTRGERQTESTYSTTAPSAASVRRLQPHHHPWSICCPFHGSITPRRVHHPIWVYGSRSPQLGSSPSHGFITPGFTGCPCIAPGIGPRGWSAEMKHMRQLRLRATIL